MQEAFVICAVLTHFLDLPLPETPGSVSVTSTNPGLTCDRFFRERSVRPWLDRSGIVR
jgi:hypothetical protein